MRTVYHTCALAISLAAAVATTAAAMPFAFVPVAAAADQIAGQWTAERSRDAGELQFGIQMRANGHSMNSSHDVPLASLQGLAEAQVASGGGGQVRFRLVREAGAFECEGWFKNGQGAGTFVFAADPEFVPAMRALGYEDFTDEEVFVFAVFDLGPSFVGELAGLGYEKLS